MSTDIVQTPAADDEQPARSPKRRDGNACRYDYRSDSPHFIEQAVTVYLRMSDAGTQWIVDSPTVDGHSLDSAHYDLSAHNSECACGNPDQCEAARQAAEKLPLPNAIELIALLANALP